MKGVVFLGDRRCEVREFPVGEPGHGEALLKLQASGICGSDLHVYRGPHASDQLRGHEPCGVVERLGPDIVALQVGDRVSVHHHWGCGVCPACARGETVACPRDKCFGVSVPGSFGEYTLAPERNCIPLPESVSFIDGAFMACVGGTAYGALKRLGAVAHDTLAVYGLGPVGLSCVLVAKAMGLHVIGLDVVPERVELGERCGADQAVLASGDEATAAVRDFSGGGADNLIETSGSTGARHCIIPSLRRGGKAAVVGVGSPERVINPSDIHGRAATLIGSVVFPLGWSHELARFLARSGMSFEPAVTHRFSLDDAPEALRTADEGRCGKVVFQT